MIDDLSVEESSVCKDESVCQSYEDEPWDILILLEDTCDFLEIDNQLHSLNRKESDASRTHGPPL